MSNIDTIAASVGFVKPAQRMLTRDQQIAKYLKLAGQAMISSQLNAEQARGQLKILRSIAPDGLPAAQVRERAERLALSAEQAAQAARLYLDQAAEAIAADPATTYPDK